MSSLFDSLSEELFQILKGSGKTLTLYGSDGNKTYDPKKARRVFAVPGNLMVSVTEAGSDSEVKLYLSQSTDVQEIAPLIQTLRQITTRYNVLFNVRKFGRELQPKDFAYQVSMTEAAMWGSTKTSYQKFGPTKLIIRHTAPVREGVIGARGRNILGMFVETQQGERFKFPANHLSGGRAFAQHINQGGKPHDTMGTQIAELAMESLQLAATARYIHHSRNVLDENATALRPVIKRRVMEIRRAFSALARPRGYNIVKEAGLPLMQSNLLEGTDDEVSRLGELLQIDINHSLAEALKPVALLTLGEHMTNMNNEFRGVIALDEDVANALVEALSDEYGHDQGWEFGATGLSFTTESAYADARSYLDLIEAAYMVNEDDAITQFAQSWVAQRDGNNDHDSVGAGDMTSGDKAQIKGRADDLAAGLKAIISGQVNVPDYTDERGEPLSLNFASDADMQRVFAGQFVDAGVLPNDTTANFVSDIVSKMEHGAKLNANERFIISTLAGLMKKDIYGESIDEAGPYSPEHGWDMEHKYWRDNPEAKFSQEMEFLVDQFDYDAFWNDYMPDPSDPDSFAEPLDAADLLDSVAHTLVYQLDNMDMNATKEQVQDEAKEIFKHIRKEAIEKGFKFNDLNEFAQFEDKPEHHGIAVGDDVATDLGHGKVVSIEGDIAVVEFLNGQAKTMHVDDMDKVPGLSSVAEEAELAEWFASFNPAAVLEKDINWAHGIPGQEKKTVAGFDATIRAGDRVTHSVYGAGEVVADNGKFVKVRFDAPHVRLPDDNTVTLQPGRLTKAGGATKDVEEAYAWGQRSGKFTDYLEIAGVEDVEVEVEYYMDDDIAMIDDITVKGTGEKIDFDTLDQRTRDSMTNRAHEEEAEEAAAAADYKYDQYRDDKMMGMYDESEELDELSPGRLSKYFDQGATSRGRLERKADDGDTEAARKLAKRDQGLGRAFKKMREDDEEVLGGDQGQDLIDDTKVTEAPEDVFRGYSNEMLQAKLNLAQNTPGHEEYAEHVRAELARRGVTEDQMFREELEKLIKNAMFRR